MFQPHKGYRFILKTPRLYEPQGVRELGERGPQKKRAVRGHQVGHGKRAQVLYAHGRVMMLRSALYPFGGVPPRGICVADGVFFDRLSTSF